MPATGVILWDVSSDPWFTATSSTVRTLRQRIRSSLFPRIRSFDHVVAFGEAARIVPEKELTDYGYGAPYGTHLAGAFDLAEALLNGTSGPNRVLTVMYSPPTIHTDPMGQRIYNWPPSEEAAAETAQAAARLGVRAFIDAMIIVPDDDQVMKVIDAAEDVPFRHRLACTPNTLDREIDIFLTTVGWPVASET